MVMLSLRKHKKTCLQMNLSFLCHNKVNKVNIKKDTLFIQQKRKSPLLFVEEELTTMNYSKFVTGIVTENSKQTWWRLLLEPNAVYDNSTTHCE